MRQDWDTYFMNLAKAASERATCPKRHVGAVLVDYKHNVISTGYNGAPSGEPHCDDVGCLEENPNKRCTRTIHAEENAIRRAGRWKRRGSWLYITHFPCYNCASLVVHSGIVAVMYDKTLRRDVSNIYELFEKEGIVITQINPE